VRQLTFKDDGCCYCVGFDPMPKCSCWCHTPDERETDMPETFIDYEDGAPRTPVAHRPRPTVTVTDYTRTETVRTVVYDETRTSHDGAAAYIWPSYAVAPRDSVPTREVTVTTPPRQSEVPWEWAHENMCKVADLDFDHPARQYVARIITDTIAEYRS